MSAAPLSISSRFQGKNNEIPPFTKRRHSTHLTMPQLYLQEYAKNLAGRRVCIACREGILRDYFAEIVADVKFLGRKDIHTSLIHNLPNRFANQKLLKELEKKLPATNLVRLAPEVDFYEAVLGHPDTVAKLIFLERRYLSDRQGNKINALTTRRVRESLADFGDFIANVNFRDTMNRICEKIEAGGCERVHILPAARTPSSMNCSPWKARER